MPVQGVAIWRALTRILLAKVRHKAIDAHRHANIEPPSAALRDEYTDGGWTNGRLHTGFGFQEPSCPQCPLTGSDMGRFHLFLYAIEMCI